MLVELDDELTKCSICMTKFSTDSTNKDPEIRKHLPVLSSSQRCDHWFCHGCVLKEQLRVAEENNGRVPKWINCLQCKEKTSFNLEEPRYHRLLIDLLNRAQKYAAGQVKVDDKGKSVDAELTPPDAICMKKEGDTVNEEEEKELKRSDLTPRPLFEVKEGAVDECDDLLSLLEIESVTTATEMTQSTADTSNDEQSSISESSYDSGSSSSSSSSCSSSSSSRSSCSSSSSYSYEVFAELLTMKGGK